MCSICMSSICMCMRCRVPPCVPQTSSPLAIDNHHTCRSLPHSSAMPSICSRPGGQTQSNNTKTRMTDLVRRSGRMPRRIAATTPAQGTRHEALPQNGWPRVLRVRPCCPTRLQVLQRRRVERVVWEVVMVGVALLRAAQRAMRVAMKQVAQQQVLQQLQHKTQHPLHHFAGVPLTFALAPQVACRDLP